MAQAGDVDYGAMGSGTPPPAGGRTDRRRRPSGTGHGQDRGQCRCGRRLLRAPDRTVVAVEPSEAMIGQRRPSLGPVVRGVAGSLPFRDGAFDAAMATVTVHQWPDPVAGLRELRRVATGAVAVLTFDPDALDRLWLAEYAPTSTWPSGHAIRRSGRPSTGSAAHHRSSTWRSPSTARTGSPRPTSVARGLPRPEVRRAQSAWSFVDDAVEARYVRTLAEDLASGRWDARHGELRSRDQFHGASACWSVGPTPLTIDHRDQPGEVHRCRVGLPLADRAG